MGLPRAVSRCVLAGDGHVCNGKPQWHHPIKQQRIRDRFPRGAFLWRGEWKPVPKLFEEHVYPTCPRMTQRAILRDPRNRIWACWDAHQSIEGDVKNLPESVWEFAREFGLDAQLENDIARQR